MPPIQGTVHAADVFDSVLETMAKEEELLAWGKTVTLWQKADAETILPGREMKHKSVGKKKE